MAFDKWTFLKVLELCLTIACFICKRITDDEASRLFLYLQKLSREWSLLNNITWDKVGAATADITYGGYVIITFALLLGRIFNEIPTPKRIIEIIFLIIGAILFVILGSLEFASIDSVPPDLVDNAAVLGALSLITAALFLLDLGGPRAKIPHLQPPTARNVSQPLEAHKPMALHPNQTELEKIEQKELAALETFNKRPKEQQSQNGHGPNITSNFMAAQNGYKKIKENPNQRFDIYGKDADEKTTPIEKHSPVWSQIRKGQYGKCDISIPSYLYTKPDGPELHPEKQPSGPGDPGYVQYTAQNWGQSSQKTPRHSPTQV